MFTFMYYAFTLYLLSLDHIFYNQGQSKQQATIQCLNEYKNNQSTIGNTKLVESATAVINSYKETSKLNFNSLVQLIPRSDIPCLTFCMQKQSGAVDENGDIVGETIYKNLNFSSEMKQRFDECYHRIQKASTNRCEKSLGIELCTFPPELIQRSLDGGMKLSDIINEVSYGNTPSYTRIPSYKTTSMTDSVDEAKKLSEKLKDDFAVNQYMYNTPPRYSDPIQIPENNYYYNDETIVQSLDI